MRFTPLLRILRSSKLALVSIVLIGILNDPVPAGSQSVVERGQLVYDAEGCSDCHTGSGRKAPNLSQAGARRSTLWIKMHLYDPAEVSGSSIMPPYAVLFTSTKGNDLVAYLESLRGTTNSDKEASQSAWHLPVDVISSTNPSDGQQLYSRYCATCHNANGRTRLKWQSEFIESPAILRGGAIQASPAALNHLAQIIKFGIPDSDMASHENMPDKDIASLVAWLTRTIPASSISEP
jgi:mono/diheme cytochrome c family protein